MFYSFLLFLITMTAAAAGIFTECSAFEDFFPYTNERATQERVNRMMHEERHRLNWCTDLCYGELKYFAAPTSFVGCERLSIVDIAVNSCQVLTLL